jgi:hypothetical protein
MSRAASDGQLGSTTYSRCADFKVPGIREIASAVPQKRETSRHVVWQGAGIGTSN